METIVCYTVLSQSLDLWILVADGLEERIQNWTSTTDWSVLTTTTARTATSSASPVTTTSVTTPAVLREKRYVCPAGKWARAATVLNVSLILTFS